MSLFNSKKYHYLIPLSLAMGAFQVLIAVIALTISWQQLQEVKKAKMEINESSSQIIPVSSGNELSN